MPIYEYRCDKCEHRLEILQKISDKPATNCPECGKDSLRKLVSAAAFKLKGTGWYETDFKDKKPKSESKTNNNNKTDDKKSNDSDPKKTDAGSKEPAKTTKEAPKTTSSSTSTE